MDVGRLLGQPSGAGVAAFENQPGETRSSLPPGQTLPLSVARERAGSAVPSTLESRALA